MTSPTRALGQLARDVYGTDWAAQVGRLTGTSVRTCQRIRSAEIQGREYRGADEVLRRLAHALYDLAEKAKHYRAEGPPQSHQLESGQRNDEA